MARALLAVGVTLVLLIAAGCDRKSCLGGDCEATRPCGDLVAPMCAAPQLFAGTVASADPTLRLAGGQGAAGDVLVSNGVVTAVWSALDAPTDLAPTGGNLIDFGPAGGRDDVTIVYQLAGILPDDAFAYRSIEVVDRAPDYLAVVLRGTLDGRPDVQVATRYELYPCEAGLRVRSELFNGSPDPQAFVVADAAHWGKRRVVPFVPAPGQGYQQPELDLLELTDLWSPYDLVGGATPAPDAPGYGVVACDAPSIHGVNDLEISALGTAIELVRPGDSMVLERLLVSAGAGAGPGPAMDALYQARGELEGDPTVVVSGRVTAGGMPFGGDVRRASLMFFRDGTTPVNTVVPAADGTWRASVPATSGLTYELWSFGRPVARGEVPREGGMIGDQAIELPATLQVAVTRGGTGPSTPIHAVAVLEPADDATRAAVAGTLHGRLVACAPWLGPPDGGSPACNRVLVDPAGTEVEAPPGRYWVYATAGPEHTLARQEVTLVAGEIATVALELRPIVLHGAGWLGADLHVHGRASFDSGLPDGDRVRSFVAAGVDVVAATDHDVIADYADAVAALGVADRVKVMGGLETTQLIPWLEVPGEDLPRVIGHFNFWPLTPVPGSPRGGAPWDERLEPGELFDLMDALTGADGIAMINHPWDEPQFGRDLGYLRAIDFDPRRPVPGRDDGSPNGQLLRAPGGRHRNLDWDVMEVQNGAGADEYAKSRPLWFALIGSGHPVAGVASSDAHGLRDNQLGWGRTWIETGGDLSTATPSAINGALRAGRAVAGSGVFVEVTIGPPGAPRRGLGLTPVVPAAGDVVTITVRAAPWIPVAEVRAVTAAGERVLVRDLPAPADPFGEAGVVRWRGEVALAELVGAADDWIVIEAGLPLPAYADLDDDGVPDTGDNDRDGDVDQADVEEDEDAGPIENPPDPTEPADPRYHMTRVVPASWPIGFTSPLLVDVDGGGWIPPARGGS